MLFHEKNNTPNKKSDFQVLKDIILNNDNQASMDEAVNNWQVDTESINSFNMEIFEKELRRFFNEFGQSKEMVLSTSYNDKVTSRMMSIIVKDDAFYFQTDCTFRKYAQIINNPNVALCIGNIQIEGLCEETGKPDNCEEIVALYKECFPGSYDLYTRMPNERIFKIRPTYIQKYFYENGKPYIEKIDITARTYEKNLYAADTKPELPNKINKIISGLEIHEIKDGHCSGDLVYRISDRYILKISSNHERLDREKRINDFLDGRLPVSRSIAYTTENGNAYYLKSMVKGDDLLTKKYLDNPVLLADILSKAIKMIHSIDIKDCEFVNEESAGNVFVHGDMCLPNVLAVEEEVSGIIDTESCGIGDPWIDYAWCIWSYEYNLGTKEYTPILLEKLGIEFDEEKYRQYINMDE